MKERIRKIKDNPVVAGIAVLLITVWTALRASDTPLSVGKMGKDSEVYRYIAKVILKGGMPYRDSFDHKGPLVYLLDALGMTINESVGIWIIELISALATLFIAYKLARLVGCSRLAAVVSTLACAFSISYYLQGGNLVEEYACPFIMLSLYIFVKYFHEKTVKCHELLLCGASCAAVCLLRVNMVALWAVMCIGVILSCIREKKAGFLGRYIAWFVAGFAVVAAPVLIWLASGNAVSAFIDDYFWFNLKYSSDAERASFANVFNSTVSFAMGLPFVLCAVIFVHYAIEKRRLVDRLTVITLVVSLLSMGMSGQESGHYGLILCPLIGYAAALLFGEVCSGERGKELQFETANKTRKIRLVTLKACALVILLFAVCRNRPTVMSELGNGLEEIAAVIQANSTKDEKIAACGNRDCIYLESDRMSFSVYSYQDPIAEIDSAIRKEYLEGIRNLEPAIIVTTDSNILWRQMKQTVEENYTLLETINGTKIYRRK